MSFTNHNYQSEITTLIRSIANIFSDQKMHEGIIAVSGGIDSAVALALLTQAIGVENVTPVFLPYGSQMMDDAVEVVRSVGISEQKWVDIDIEPMVKVFTHKLELDLNRDKFRLGNIMARCRMIAIFDIAKKMNGLVCGTENKSEKYLGYFTRFGDEASDLEPIQQFYKSQIKILASLLKIPEKIINKQPSAGLWLNQTDELELGFSYEIADRVLEEYIDRQKKPEDIIFSDISPETVKIVLQRVQAMKFKLEVPYNVAS